MSSKRIFIDFGSTYTKVAAFDLEKEELIARVQAPSSVDTDVFIGLRQALDKLSETIPVTDDDIRNALACSSAAGGLRMVCIGLVPEYTTEAGRLAALGAGAKIIGTYSYELSRTEAEEIAAAEPDIVLLTGGTDGGNKRTITHNAKVLAGIGGKVSNIIVAGNKSANDDIADIFDGIHKNVYFTKNVMPEFGKLDLDPVNGKIREIFIKHITEAKGISRVREIIGDVIMPTPSAVFEAAHLLADGVPGEEYGIGELLIVDVGGATTDVYTVGAGTPSRKGVTMVGLPEPYVKRTVEGDLGMFHNLDTLAELAEQESPMSKAAAVEFEEKITALHEMLSVPQGEEQTHFHLMLSRLAVKTAVDRHVGKLELRETPNGELWLQHGKDMTHVKTVIGAGGPLAFSADPRYVLGGAALSDEASMVLKPRNPKFMLDSRYILFAIGLLAQSEPLKALRIIKKYLVEI